MRCLLLLVSLISASFSLTCHSCSGAEYLPSTLAQALQAANVSTTYTVSGNCNGTTGSDVCSSGQFCLKNAVVYKLNLIGNLGLSWTTFTKGCTDVRADNGETPKNQCYDVNTTTYDNGYTATVRQCYCQSNLCNASPIQTPLLTALGTLLSILLFK